MGYTIKSLQELRVAINFGVGAESGATGEDDYSFGNQFKWFKKDNAYINLLLEKAF